MSNASNLLSSRKPAVPTALFIALILLAAALPAPRALSHEALREEARAMTDILFNKLSAELQAAMQEGGPDAAIHVCRDLAPAIKTELSLASGARVTRVGTRVRNPLLGMPNAREREVLNGFEQQRKDGTAWSDMEHFETIQVGDQRQLLYMRPIAIQPLCLSCHGPSEALPTTVRAALEASYPHDRAVGYQLGDLRGAFSVSFQLED
jgi:hypothetical protein